MRGQEKLKSYNINHRVEITSISLGGPIRCEKQQSKHTAMDKVGTKVYYDRNQYIIVESHTRVRIETSGESMFVHQLLFSNSCINKT